MVEEWCLPTVSAEFVCHMEDVLDLYAEPLDETMPVICFDESPYQLISEVRPSVPPTAGHPQRVDYEYRREGCCNLFMFAQHRAGWRHVEVTDQRTKLDFAHCMQALVDVYFPDADVISVVLDNLNTHTKAALYEAFAPAEARRIASKLDFHYTPKHGSWLNMAEIEFAILSSQCTKRRIGDRATLEQEIRAWEMQRNEQKVTVDWRFTTTNARKALKRLYPA